MPYIYVPPADYDRTMAARGARPRFSTPVEPMPDYPVTMKFPRGQMPKLDDFVDEQFASLSRFDDTRFEDIAEQEEIEEEIPRLPVSKRIAAYEERLEEPSQVSSRTKRHIKNIGVPVLPPIENNDLDLKGVSLEDNRAFLRHLANHQRYDTMRSLRTCDDCPICKLVVANHFETLQEEASESSSEPDFLPPTPPRASSSGHSGSHGRHRPDVRDIFASQ